MSARPETKSGGWNSWSSVSWSRCLFELIKRESECEREREGERGRV